MKKIYIKNILLFITFLIGLSIFLYPIVTGFLSYQDGLEKIKIYERNATEIKEEDYTEIIANAHKYNTDLITKGEMMLDEEERYYNQLNVVNADIMGYIYIEKLNIDLPVYHGIEEETLQVGVGHFQGSSLPVGGYGTHCALFGHRGLPTSKLFTNLDKLRDGDIFVLKILKEKLYYKVDQIVVIEPDEIWDYIGIEQNRDLVTLVTCTPYGINTQRLLIRGTRTTEQMHDIENIFNKNYRNNILIIITLFLIVIIIISAVVMKIHQRSKRQRRKLARHELIKKKGANKRDKEETDFF